MATLTRIKSKRGVEYEGNLGVMILMFVIMGGIIYYAIVATPTERGKLGINLEKFQKELLDISPGLVKGVPLASVETGLHQMQDIVVDGRAFEKTTSLRTQVKLVKSIFSDQIANISFELNTENIRGATVLGSVQDGDVPADLMIIFNGHELSRETLVKGRQFSIDLPMSYLSTTNTLQLQLAPESAFKRADYTLSSIDLVTLSYDAAKSSEQRSFTLTDTEFSGLKSATLSAYIRSLTTDSGRLTIDANGKQIYDDFPLQDFKIKIPATYLRAGQNNLLFKISKGSGYGLGFVQMQTEFGREPSVKSKDYTFSVSGFVANGAQLNKMDCPLTIRSQNPQGELTVHLNSGQATEPLINSTTTIDVCRYLKQDDNVLFFTASKEVTINRATLLVKEK